MGLYSTQVQTLNEIMKAIDEKATIYKDQRFDMRTAQSDASKKLLMDLIQDALDLSAQMKPEPVEVVNDLKRLADQLSDMH